MSRYEYSVIADKIDNKGGFQPLKAKAVTIHHTAVVTEGEYSVVERVKGYTRSHGGSMPYHFYIPRNEDNNIYVTQWLNQAVVHNTNWDGNRNCLSVCVEGNFDKQTPSKTQLAKLKQLLDDLSSDYLENQLGYIEAFREVNPQNNITDYVFSGEKVKNLHYHNEVAQTVEDVKQATKCCGVNLIPYVLDYRDKAGKVSWLITEKEQKMIDELTNKNKELEATNRSLKDELTAIEKIISDKDGVINIVKTDMEVLKNNFSRLQLENKELNDKIIALENPVMPEKPNTPEFKFMELWNKLSPRVQYYFPYVSGILGGIIATVNFDQDWKTVAIAVVTYIFTYINGLKAVSGIADKQELKLYEKSLND